MTRRAHCNPIGCGHNALPLYDSTKRDYLQLKGGFEKHHLSCWSILSTCVLHKRNAGNAGSSSCYDFWQVTKSLVGSKGL